MHAKRRWQSVTVHLAMARRMEALAHLGVGFAVVRESLEASNGESAAKHRYILGWGGGVLLEFRIIFLKV